MPNKTPDQFDQGGERRVEKLERELEDMRYQLRQLADASSFQHVVQKGFEELTERLVPLRELAPTRQPLNRRDRDLLHRVRASLARPDLTRPPSGGGIAQIATIHSTLGSTAS